MARAYAVLAVIGAAVPIFLGALFLRRYGLDGAEFIRQPFGTTVGTLAMADLGISSLVFWVWMARESARTGVARWWPFALANLLVGLSFALPLFLYVRARRLESSAAAGGPARPAA